MPTANEIQKERICEIEQAATELLERCDTVALASVNEQSYPRVCTVSKIRASGFRELWFMTSRRSELNGKAVHFAKNPRASVCYTSGGDTVSLIGEVRMVEDVEEKRQFAQHCDRRFFKDGVESPRCVILHFRAIEATFWIGGKFRTVKYKL